MNDIIQNLLYVVVAGFIIIAGGALIFACHYKIKQWLNLKLNSNLNNENQLLV